MKSIKQAKNIIIQAGKIHNARLEDVSKMVQTLYDTTIKEILYNESVGKKEKRKGKVERL